MSAPFRLNAAVFGSPRFEVLGQIAGYNAHEALGRWARAGSECTERQSYVLSEPLVAALFGPRGVEGLLAAELAQRTDGGLRMLEMDGEIEWYGGHTENKRRAGLARARGANRDQLGRLLPRQHGASTTSTNPAAQAPDTENATSQLPSVQQPSTTPARAGVLDQQSTSTWPAASSSPSPVRSPSDTHAPRAIVRASSWERHKAWWDCMLAAHDRLRKPSAMRAAIKPNAPDLAKHPNEQMLAACERYLRDGGYDEAGIDAKMRHVPLVYEAEAEALGHLDYFKPALIWDTTRPDRFPRKVDTSLEEARRMGAPSRAGPRRAEGAAIGAASPRTDHPVSASLIPINEL